MRRPVAGETTVVSDTDEAFWREAEGPLPDGLQLLSLEFRLYDNEVHGPLTRRLYWDEEMQAAKDVDAIVRWGSALEWCFSTIGAACFVDPNTQSVFGTATGRRLRVDIIAAPAVIERWGCNEAWSEDEEGNPEPLTGLQILGPKNAKGAARGTADVPGTTRLLSSMAHRARERGWHDHEFKGLYRFELYEEGENGKSRPGDFARWVRAVQATDADFERLVGLLRACNGDFLAVRDHLRRLEAEPATQSFLVPGLIPRGAITLLLGNRKVGKSAIALELAVVTARRRGESWLGFPVDAGRGGFAVYMFGEDSAGEVIDRVRRMAGGETPFLLQTVPAVGGACDIDKALADMRKQKVALLIVDPARKFFRGDEDGSDAVSDFFTKLETFAKDKDCAVVVLHHLKRGAPPRTLADVAAAVRGTGVFLDRPRVTLAALRAGEETQFGIPAPDDVPLHNFRQSTMFSGVRRSAPGRGGDVSPCASGGAQRTATKEPTSRRKLGRGPRGHQSHPGQWGETEPALAKRRLWERKPPELAGMSRAAVRSTQSVCSISQGDLGQLRQRDPDCTSSGRQYRFDRLNWPLPVMTERCQAVAGHGHGLATEGGEMSKSLYLLHFSLPRAFGNGSAKLLISQGISLPVT